MDTMNVGSYFYQAHVNIKKLAKKRRILMLMRRGGVDWSAPRQ
jgi:hypothetical protein